MNSGSLSYRYGICNTLIRGDVDVNKGLELLQKELDVMPEHETLRWLKAIGLYEQEKYVESLKMLRRIRDEKTDYNYQINHDIQMAEEALAKQKGEQ